MSHTSLTEYDSFHQNNVNKWIHIVCIPALVWSSFVQCHRYAFYNIRLSFVLFVSYLYKYWKLSPALSLRVGCFYFLLYRHSKTLFYSTSLKLSHRLSVSVFILSWIGQFIGHGVFEKNTPAILNGAYNSFVVGPLFAYKHFEDFVYEWGVGCISRYLT